MRAAGHAMRAKGHEQCSGAPQCPPPTPLTQQQNSILIHGKPEPFTLSGSLDSNYISHPQSTSVFPPGCLGSRQRRGAGSGRGPWRQAGGGEA